MEGIYKITTKSQMFIVKELIKSGIVFVVGCYLFLKFVPCSITLAVVGFACGYLILDIIPVVIVHYKYYQTNKTTEVRIDKTENVLVIKEKAKVYTIRFCDIKYIGIAMTADMYQGRKGGLSSYCLYQYAFIETNNDQGFIITCLVVNELAEFFKELKLETTKEFSIFPIVGMWRGANH
jgi:hypothetical protein